MIIETNGDKRIYHSPEAKDEALLLCMGLYETRLLKSKNIIAAASRKELRNFLHNKYVHCVFISVPL